MENNISVENLIKAAISKGIDFGKGDPYNRLRYYTKIGWLPHMTRATDKKGNIIGQYPNWALEQLLLIEQLKSRGLSNEQIDRQIKRKGRIKSIIQNLTSVEIRNQALTVVSLTLLFLIFISQIGLVDIGVNKQKTPEIRSIESPIQIVNNGTGFVPKNSNKVYIKASEVDGNTRVYVTFTQNYTPATTYWVSKIEPYSGFEIQLDAPVANNSEFFWWVSK